MAANPTWWWTVVGALSITLMFRFVSLPMIETRMLERRPGYAEFARSARAWSCRCRSGPDAAGRLPSLASLRSGPPGRSAFA